MRKILLKILIFVLKYFSRLIILRYKPVVVGVSGTVGKSSTKEAIYNILKANNKVWVSRGSFNNEFGLPLTILGGYHQTGGPLFWLKVLFLAFLKIIFKSDYPEFLVLEYGADKPKDIDYLLQIVSPSIGVFVSSSDVPVHVEFYSNPKEVAEEDAKIISALPKKGFAILNFDDKTVLSSKNLTKAKVLTYGFNKGADVRITGFKSRCQGYNPLGIIFELQYQKQSVTVEIDGVFGRGQAYAIAAGAAVGLILGLTFKEIADIFPFYQSLPGRLKLIKGIKSCYVIDDSYNASPSSTKEALDVLKDLKARRKVAILGDMLELGEYSIKAHENIGKLAADFVDILITVGSKAKFIAEGAEKAGFPKKNILSFSNSSEAKINIEEIIRPDDLILIKGSQGARMEKISFKIMAEPAEAMKLLPRQYGKWLK